jgi:hypothetical protein
MKEFPITLQFNNEKCCGFALLDDDAIKLLATCTCHITVAVVAKHGDDLLKHDNELISLAIVPNIKAVVPPEDKKALDQMCSTFDMCANGAQDDHHNILIAGNGNVHDGNIVDLKVQYLPHP